MMSRNLFTALFFAVLATASAFVPSQPCSRPALIRLEAKNSKVQAAKQFITVASATIATTAAPLVALAIEDDGYEYGAVDAPIGIAWAVGALAIATALLPIAMSGGEDAFNEMKEQDKGGWGSGNSDKLNKRR